MYVIVQSLRVTERITRGAIKASVDGYNGSHFMACSSVAAASEAYQAFANLPSKGVDPFFRPATTTTGRTPTTPNVPSTSKPATSESRGDEATGKRSRPMQPFVLDESISDLTIHECYWVTWAAVRPGVFFGM